MIQYNISNFIMVRVGYTFYARGWTVKPWKWKTRYVDNALGKMYDRPKK